MSEPLRTSPLSVWAGALGSVQNAVIPAIAIAFSGVGGGGRFVLAIGVGMAAIVIGSLITYLGWRRFTYLVGEADIRVESGILTRQARSIPYERIQDVSLAEPLLARLFGLVAVKFETGAGGGEDISLSYVTAAEAERLRHLVRERREENAAGNVALAGGTSALAEEPAGEQLFAMGPHRLVTFGLFEFSLAVFAVLFGLLQYADSLVDLSIWDVRVWEAWLSEQGTWVARLGPAAQMVGAIIGLITLILIGFLTGLARTIAREWGFVLERTPRGFRRRRGLFTRTDVVMPAHRVQALHIGTGLVRYRFGWHSLSFVSLAQDNESASHDVAPFATMAEIAPIAAAAGFRLPDAGTQWQRASTAYRNDRILGAAAILAVIAAVLAIFAPFGWFLIPIGVALVATAINLYEWEFRRRHAIDETQVYAMHGLLAPQSEIGKRLKLHSVEVAQGPIARLRGYATLHLGLAGGVLAIHGLPLARARELRRAVLDTMCAKDFAHI
ncbi:MAG: PH domain-containing protein [Erythrobacter sp.]